MAEWVYLLHAPREDFAETMTEAESAIWARHFGWLRGLLADGSLVLAGPTLGRTNTGIVVFEAADEDAARSVMTRDPVLRAGFATGELRPFRISLLRGRD